jgi:hypothetical protein
MQLILLAREVVRQVGEDFFSSAAAKMRDEQQNLSALFHEYAVHIGMWMRD